MSRVAYIDCFSGASGDMLLGALVDAGLAIERLREELRTLPLDGYRIAVERVQRAGIAATSVRVIVSEEVQPHRRLDDIRAILAATTLPDTDREQALRVFVALAEAEARVHGVTPEEIAFHEVGAVDAIVDIVGTVVGLRLLGIEAVYASPLPVGRGIARSMHGLLPVPAPATLELLAGANAPLTPYQPGDDFELLTPTAAALLTCLARFEQPALRLERIGYGAGARDTPGRPNVLRLWLGETASAGADEETEPLLVVETNIDDTNPQIYGWLLERLFAAGALDAWLTPAYMKKNRPGTIVHALCRPDTEPAIADVLLRESTTLGVRRYAVERRAVPREIVRFASSLGEVRVKLKRLPGEAARIAPEYDDCVALARASGLPLIEVYRIVTREAEDALLSSAAESRTRE